MTTTEESAVKKLARLTRRTESLGERKYIEPNVMLKCGHPAACLEEWDDWDEALCGWCEDAGSERMGAGMAIQVVRTESQEWVEEHMANTAAMEHTLMQFIASLSLADHMGDASNSIDELFTKMGWDKEGLFDDDGINGSYFGKRGIRTLNGIEFGHISMNCDYEQGEKHCDREATELWVRREDGPDAKMLTKNRKFCGPHGVNGELRHSRPGPSPDTIRINFDIKPLR